MCNRHELPPLIEHDVPGIVSNRIKRKDIPLDTSDPIDLDPITESIFKGLRNALIIMAVAAILIWGGYNAFKFYQVTKPILAMGDWSQQ
ncbi:hypothetical protein Q9292_09995 [Methylophilus sp. VKM B-3414]|uniref:hypothetical protein n=1 Tax=Methylophilus sp. VKM B-3414 TaxID=3076121 RepID=UPI0028CAC5FA|nr:hypothetical protein [Methylophilus sp. VKM B-3414]MDT7849942.1 hypothetical protein [Methylophilus sp. VKM B-3414]